MATFIPRSWLSILFDTAIPAASSAAELIRSDLRTGVPLIAAFSHSPERRRCEQSKLPRWC